MDCDEEVKQDGAADDIEAQFLTSFACMNTEDRDSLVNRYRFFYCFNFSAGSFCL